MNHRFTIFYESWLNKAHGYSENSTAEIFDKFISLFIIYNFEYNQIARLLRLQGEHIYNRYDDRKAATDWVISFIGAQNIADLLDEQSLSEEVGKIIEIIENERFYIKLNWGERQRNQDLKILNRLQSSNSNDKAKGILEVIYYVRCNLFHGHKEFIGEQRQLLIPLCRILEKLVEMIRERL